MLVLCIEFVNLLAYMHISFFFLHSLSKEGRLIIMSIHQPRYSIFRLFDYLTLLSKGEIIYHGEASKALSYFSSDLRKYHYPQITRVDTYISSSLFTSWLILGVKSREVPLHQFYNFSSFTQFSQSCDCLPISATHAVCPGWPSSLPYYWGHIKYVNFC